MIGVYGVQGAPSRVAASSRECSGWVIEVPKTPIARPGVRVTRAFSFEAGRGICYS